MIDKALQWFYDKKAAHVTYSMTNRNGPNSYDCSSSVYNALISGGLLPSMRIGNTDSLFGDLERNGWIAVPDNAQGGIDCQRGDVFIWGGRGASSGASGHTGMFIDPANIINCAYGYNGIAVCNHDWLWSLNGSPQLTIYRYVGSVAAAVNDPNDQSVDVGSTIKFTGTFTVDDLQLIDGIYQVRTNALCPSGFDWNDNGLPVEPLVEIDAQGNATASQDLSVGSFYRIPGKFTVLDWGNSGFDIALIQLGGYKVWVALAPATEIAASADGTPTPQPATVTTPPAPTETSTQPVETPAAVVVVPQPVIDPTKDIPQSTTSGAPFTNGTAPVLSVAVKSEIDKEANQATDPKLKSIIRTVVPVVVGQVVAFLALHNVHLDDSTVVQLTAITGGVVTTVYYSAVRFIEAKFPKAGLLLGATGAPKYKETK